MADQVYEFVCAPASDALLANQAVAQPALDILRRQTPHPIFSGIQTEKPSLWVVIAWNNISSHSNFSSSADHALFKNALGATVTGDKAPTVVHAMHFSVDPLPAFRQPVTEMAWITPQAGISREQVAEVCKAILQIVRDSGQESAPGGGALCVDVKGRPEVLLLVIGWTDLEAHEAFVREGAPANEIVAKLKTIATVEMSHANFKSI